MADQSLSPSTPTLTRLTALLAQISDRKEAEPFRAPVDYEAFGLTDYPLIVKRMMDLGTLQSNLQSGRYSTLKDCLDDLQLIWDNCKLYNVEFSKIYKVAQKLEDYSRKLIEENFGKIEYGKNNPSYKSLEQVKTSQNGDE